MRGPGTGDRCLSDAPASVLDVTWPGECASCGHFCSCRGVERARDVDAVMQCCLCRQRHTACHDCNDRALVLCLATSGLSSASHSSSHSLFSASSLSSKHTGASPSNLRSRPLEIDQAGDDRISVVETPPEALPLDPDFSLDGCSGHSIHSTRDDVQPAGISATEQIPVRGHHVETVEQPDTAGTPTTQAFLTLVAQMNFKTADAGKVARRLPERYLSGESGIAGPVPPADLPVPAAFSPALPAHAQWLDAFNTPPVGYSGAAGGGGGLSEEERLEWSVDLETAPLLGTVIGATGAGMGDGIEGRLEKSNDHKMCRRIFVMASLAAVALAAVAIIVVVIRCGARSRTP